MCIYIIMYVCIYIYIHTHVCVCIHLAGGAATEKRAPVLTARSILENPLP